jgi:hypothetical protein
MMISTGQLGSDAMWTETGETMTLHTVRAACRRRSSRCLT